MPRFRFRLQRLLDLRERVEQQRRAELAQHTAARVQAQQALANANESLAQEKLALADALRLKGQHAHLAHDACAQSRTIVAVHGTLPGLSDHVELRRAEEVGASARLAQASSQRRAIDRLHQKRREQWQADQDDREQHTLDEIASRMRAIDAPDPGHSDIASSKEAS